MKQIKLYIGLLLLSIMSLICYAGNYLFTKTKQDVFAEVNYLFDLSIREDKSSRMNNLEFSIHQGYSDTDKRSSLTIKSKNKTRSVSNADKIRNLTQRDKDYKSDHNYLQYKNPIKINILDGLFKTKLQENNIFLQTEIQYIVNADTAYSTKSRAFYATALPLEKITTGVSDQIILQAFVKPSFLYRISPIIAISTGLLFFISVGGLIWIFVYKKNEEELLVVDETNTLLLSPLIENPKFIKQISNTIFFNEEKKALIRNGETVCLVGARLTIFLLMMKSDDYFVQSATIKSQLWPKLDDVKDSFNTTMARLRTDLKPFPELKVYFDSKRKGYYLKVVSV